MLKPFYRKGVLEAGCDEAGRGCIAGPVFAAAVILPGGFSDPSLDDSKKLTKRIRQELRVIIEQEAISFGIGMASEKEIDQINILNASFLAMHRAIKELDPGPEHLLVDGNRFRPFGDLPFSCIVKGDSIFASIAAASVLAKTYRDQYMELLHQNHPRYGWISNKGYPTRTHRRAIMEYGPTIHHRRSFRLLDEQTKLEF
jgi:ribonuclease HII